jgi:acylpyruvate hydrolase
MKIFCVGRNYADHAAEMQAEVPQQPVIFLKPDTALLRKDQDFYYPPFSQDIHYECELFFRISKEGKHIQQQFAFLHLDVLGLGIDFTARDLQQQLKAKSLPWELSKAFDFSAAVSTVLPLNQFPDLNNIQFKLLVNGETRQQGHSSQMIFKIDYLVSFISQYITLRSGDLIFTGTPLGVGPIHIGDCLEGFIEGERVFKFYIR